MRKVYLDVNVVFDYLLERKPFDVEAVQIFDLSRLGEIDVLTDTQTLTFVYFYMVKKDKNRRRVKNKLIKLLDFISLAHLSETALRKALAADNPTDLEDAAQLQIALEAKAEAFITRDLGDYKNVSLRVLSPAQFLTEYAKLKSVTPPTPK